MNRHSIPYIRSDCQRATPNTDGGAEDTKHMTDGSWPPLTESTVRELASSSSFERGLTYYDRGAVSDVVRRGDTANADVEGSLPQPYSVTIEFSDAGVARTACSCPYDHGGICKHRVAVLLTCLRDPEHIHEQQPVAELIADADQETLQELLVELAANRSEVADWIEPRLAPTGDDTATATVSVNPESIRRRATHALPKPGQRGHNDPYAEASRMAAELERLLEDAQRALTAGDGESGLAVVEAITEVLATNRWAGLLPHDVPDLYETIGTLGQTFTEAILMADVPERDREEWARQLTEWDGELQHFTGQSTLSMAADAARQGWSDERLQAALAGTLDEGSLEVDEPMVVDGLTTSHLAVLERQGRIEEYLNLARVAGHFQQYATMQVREGQVEEAIDCAVEQLSTPTSLLQVAKTLREHGHHAAAVRVAERGLEVEGDDRTKLATWLRDLAASLDEDELARRAAITAFEDRPTVSAYQAVEELSGDDWERVRTALLATLREQQPTSSSAAEVFITEELYDEAIAVAERSSWSRVLEPVVEGVLTARPGWAIETCKSQAEPIIEAGNHDRYETAVRWLRRAGEAARAADALDEWREYVRTMRDEHYRKYKLRPMLDELLEAF